MQKEDLKEFGDAMSKLFGESDKGRDEKSYEAELHQMRCRNAEMEHTISSLKKENERLKADIRLHESRIYEPLMIPKDAKIEFKRDELLKHLETEIAWLRSMLASKLIN
jgi:F0F1-type ATP synthase membrane subunit b/b'